MLPHSHLYNVKPWYSRGPYLGSLHVAAKTVNYGSSKDNRENNSMNMKMIPSTVKDWIVVIN